MEPQLKALPYSPATVKQDVDEQLVVCLLENQEDFPGVDVEQVFLRKYPHGEIGAHLFGTVGEVTEEQLEDERYNGVELGDRVGQSGSSPSTTASCAGATAPAASRSTRWATSASLKPSEPEQGRQLRLSVDLDVQRVGQQALAGGTGAGAFVVMDVQQRRGARARLALVRPQHLLARRSRSATSTA